MKTRNTMLSAALLFGVTFLPVIPGVKTVESAHAQWVVIDPANIVQTTLSAIQTGLSNVNEATQIANQYTQITDLVNQYNQMLTDYATMLTNLTSLPAGLKSALEADLNSTLTDITTQFGQSSMSPLAGINPASASWKSTATSLIQPVFGQPISNTTLTGLLAGVPAATAADILASNAQDNAAYDRFLDSYKMQAQAEKNATKRAGDAGTIQSNLTAAGNQSELATLQLMALQNGIVVQQLEDVVKSTNQAMVNLTDQNLGQAASLSAYRGAKLQRANAAAAAPPALAGYSQWPSM
jgi:Asp-tRNA(Asn)/Glu-tRNA(Gln) amidotransferase C subunit